MRYARFALLLASVIAFAAPQVPARNLPPKEINQGFSDRVILAKPRAQRRAEADRSENQASVRVRESFARFGDLRVIEVSKDETVADAIERLRKTGLYEFVEPDYLQSYDAIPNDPSFVAQWALQNTGQLTGSTAGVDIKAVPAWDIVREAPDVIVAVIDSGVNLTHQDIAPNLWRNPSPTFGDVNGARILFGVRSGDPTDDVGHGTIVAGIIAAAGNNGVASTGVAWKVQLMPLKNGTSAGSFTSDSAACIDYALSKGAKIINCSFGGPGFSQTLFTAIKAARDAGVIVVCSAGNSGFNTDAAPRFPSAYLSDNVVGVGNSGPTDLPSSSSDFGGLVELFAPGTSIVSLSYLSNTGVLTGSGTSMAAPHVTGSLALLRAHFPNDDHRQLINRLLRGVDRTSAYTGRAHSGGRLNLRNALVTTTSRPFNDDFATRGVISGAGSVVRSNNSGATTETLEPNHAGVSSRASLWWQWTAPSTGTVTLHTSGSDFDTVAAVYRGTTLANLIPVASNDDSNNQPTSSLMFSAQQGTTYQFVVAGKGEATGFAVVTLGSAPTNDHFARATALPTVESTSVRGNNNYSTLEMDEPRILDIPSVASVWYRWTAPRSGRFQISAFSPTIDCVLGVFTGATLNALTPVAGNDNAESINNESLHSLVTIDAEAGMTYSIKVDSRNLSLTGAFILSLTDSKWQFVGEGLLSAAPSVASDGTIYVGGGTSDPTFYAIAPDGSLKWAHAGDGTMAVCASAIATDGTIYFGSSTGVVTALKPDGSVRWKRTLDAGSASTSPSIAIDGTVYFHTTSGTIHALDPATGATKWSRDINANTFAGASIARDGTLYLACDDFLLHALRPDGTEKWRFDADSDSYSSAAIDEAGNLYFTTFDSALLYSVNPQGTQRWNFDGVFPAFIQSSPVLSSDGKTVYFGATDRNVYAVNSSDGTLQWRLALGDQIGSSTPAIDANGVIYVGCYDGRIYALNPSGTIRRTWDTGGPIASSPVIANKHLIVGSTDSKVYVFDIGADAGSGPWPQFQQNVRRTGRSTTAPLAILTQPEPRAIIASQPFTLFVGASGSDPVGFQWRRNGVPIIGARSATYTVPASSAGDAASYTVTVSSVQGTITSAPASISIEPRVDSRLSNFSVRAAPGSGSQILVLGLTLNEGRPKPMLMRAVGPTLATFGLSDTLADPVLRLFSGSELQAVNDNWGGEEALSQASRAAGAFALPPDSKDAVLHRTLSPGSYTTHITSANATTGVALAEIYDMEPAIDLGGGGSRLVNVAARAQVGTGTRVLVVGFNISGNVPKPILLRALGPAISGLGVTGVLADPVLDVFRGATRIGGNDDWQGQQALRAAFARANAFPLADSASRDSAVVLTLQPGSYTARVAGFLNSTGVALLELYELP